MVSNVCVSHSNIDMNKFSLMKPWWKVAIKSPTLRGTFDYFTKKKKTFGKKNASSCLLSPASYLLHPVSCILSPASYVLSSVSCFLSPASYLLHPVSCLSSPASYLLPPALWRRTGSRGTSDEENDLRVTRRARVSTVRARARGRWREAETRRQRTRGWKARFLIGCEAFGTQFCKVKQI